MNESVNSDILLQFSKMLDSNFNFVKLGNLNFLLPFSSNLNSLELGVLPGINFYNYEKSSSLRKNFFYLLGADDFSFANDDSQNFFIFQGHHGDKLARKANIILPGFSFFEKVSTYLTLQGFSQNTSFALMPSVGNVRND